MKKRFFSLLIASILLGCISTPAFASNTKANLYDMYSDNMLFQQNAISKISGTATSGSKIEIEIYNSKNEKILTASSKAENNSFSVEFLAPKGSFESYSITIKENGKEFRTLKNVVFGELWIASGQSNMYYPLGQEKTIRTLEDLSAFKASPYIRSMIMPTYDATIDGKSYYETLPYAPQKDVKGASWITGDSENAAGMSAVGYFFANKMLDVLNMPIGIINAPLGGTPIATWLSREAIDENEKIKNTLTETGFYIDKSSWGATQDIYRDLTLNYNLRIAPLNNFSVSGLIWYQGESDIMLSLDSEFYFASLEALHRTYSNLFGFKDKLMPIVYTQLAPYIYADGAPDLIERNIGFTEFQEKDPKSRAVVTAYDITPTFFAEVGCIHPEPKKDIGERMGLAALGLVYGKRETYTLPYIDSTEIKDNTVYVTLKNVGDGLLCDGKNLFGFAVCDETGVFVEAEAKIVNKNTVAVSSDLVKVPKAVSYAYSVTSETANLYSSENGKKLLPVSPFVTDKSYSTKYWKEAVWTNCDSETVWHNDSDLFSGFYDCWASENAEISFSKESAFSGENGLTIKSQNEEFSVKPLLTYKDEKKEVSFNDVETNYSNYGIISFYIKNNGDEEITFEGVNFIKNSFISYTPQILDSKDNDFTIPADKEWHKMTLDLTKLNLRGNECGIVYGNEKLNEIKNIEFCFSGNGNSELSIDHIRFAPAETSDDVEFIADETRADTFLQKVSAKFVNLIGNIIN